MIWVVVAAAGLTVALSLAFWKQLVNWANEHLAGWIEKYLGQESKEAFLLILAGLDRPMIIAQRALSKLQDRLLKVRLVFRQLVGTQTEVTVNAQIEQENGDVLDLEAAEIIPWHELPDEVREKFIRRQAGVVEMELKMKE